MAKKSKWFVVATEGATTDGREIQRKWIEEMAQSYDPKNTYGARINLDHIKFSIFFKDLANAHYFGDVLALKAQEREDGKLQLLAEIAPTEGLIELNQSGQKVYTSVEIDTNFADTGKAYLVGLAVTDNPASLGTEMLSFSHNGLASRKLKAENLFTAAVETLLEFEDIEEKQTFSVFEKIKALFSKKEKTDDERFADHQKSIELLAEQTKETLEKLTALSADLEKQQAEFAEMKATNESIQAKFTTLEKAPSADFGKRPIVAGEGKSEFLTDC
ncbi:GPO family capsid scaffolding protein [Aggregatibacter actinomycetemcomitans]|uniref:GPO family capsid scaffolding protein n=1 Tax=Aggregatibacter actinomycetemcomitans TaxID=714 RepID=UPI00197C1898|nr:GPO family capsid scaffolding protein [Aggregatibacter actinomycetemcomitans]MBN6081256.1 GPO family capsid scaffolding protein [Aggregatibacter actinomycetemcomitans]